MTAARYLAALVLAWSGCQKEPSMSPPSAAKPLSAFTQLQGGLSQAIAPGKPLVTLLSGSAVWWDHDAPVSATFPPARVDGAQWTSDGAALHVGLGTLDLVARAWRAEPTLEAWNRPGPDGAQPVERTAWFGDAAHVALQLKAGELVVVKLADGLERGRAPMTAVMAMVASRDRLLVSSNNKLALLDLDAKIVAEPVAPPSVSRMNAGAGMFAVTGASGAVALLRASDGAVLATWDIHANDAVPVPHGVVVVDAQGVVRVGCLDHGAIRAMAEAPTGAPFPIIQLVGDQIVVAGRDVNPIRVATFTDPCQ